MSGDAQPSFLPALVAGEAEKKEKKTRQRRGPNKTAKAKGDVFKYIEEVLGGQGPGQQLADLVTFTAKERAASKKWAKEMHLRKPLTAEDPHGFPPPSIFTPAELCLRFKVEKLRILFGLTVKDATSLFIGLKKELMPYVHNKQSSVVAPEPEDTAALTHTSDWVDGSGGEVEQNQQPNMFDDEPVTDDRSHIDYDDERFQ